MNFPAVLQTDEAMGSFDIMDWFQTRGLAELLAGFIEKHFLTVAGALQAEISISEVTQEVPAMPQPIN